MRSAVNALLVSFSFLGFGIFDTEVINALCIADTLVQRPKPTPKPTPQPPGPIVPGDRGGAHRDDSRPSGEKVAAMSSTEQAVRQLFDELVSAYAKNDATIPARIFADDFTFTNPFGEVMTKEQRIGQIKPGGVMFDSYSVDDVSVRIYGDTAVVTNRATLAGKRGDQVLAGQYRVTQVFVKKGPNWQLVAAQSTPIVEQPKQ